MVTAHRESERKFDVEGATTLPDFARLPQVARVAAPIEETLDATYFDSPDLRLAAAGVTLRRRTGGRDAGWHLKLPAADGARTELRHPLDGPEGTVPDDLARLVRGLVRHAELGPVARIRTHRTVYQLVGEQDRPLVEVADDRVNAESLGRDTSVQSWREVEVEAVDGGDAVLPEAAKLLDDSGARPAAGPSKLVRTLGDRLPRPPEGAPLRPRSPARDVLIAALRADRDRLLAADRGARLRTPDAIHQLRVAARRLRSVLGVYRPLFDRQVTDPIRAELQWLGRAVADVRDTEVQSARLDELVHGQPGELMLGPVAARIASTMSARASDADARAAEALDSDRYLRLLDQLDALVTDPPWSPDAARKARAALPRRVSRTWRRVRRRADDGQLHEVRKAAKRARYAADVVAPVFGKPAKRYAKRMKKLQGVLGDHHDAIVNQELLRDLGVQAHLAGENAFSYGLLHGHERSRADQAEAAYGELLEKVRKPRLR